MIEFDCEMIDTLLLVVKQGLEQYFNCYPDDLKETAIQLPGDRNIWAEMMTSISTQRSYEPGTFEGHKEKQRSCNALNECGSGRK